ncbi:MAG: hypothetical protein ABIG61_12120 [Planctomycetota bacterium]
MEKQSLSSPQTLTSAVKKQLLPVVFIAFIYAAAALYLYHNAPRKAGCLLMVSSFAAALGAFLLSRRWINAFIASFFAGLLYGFGPYTIGFGLFHPSASFLIAAIPFSFCPAAFCCSKKTWFRPIGKALLFTLPFLVIFLFFWLPAGKGLFPLPIHIRLHLSSVKALLTPLAADPKQYPLVSFCHAPLAPLFMGLIMLIIARRPVPILLLPAGIFLASCDSILGISPIVFAAISVLTCAVLVGAGCQALVSATAADQKWLITAAAITLVLLTTTLALGLYNSRLFLFAAKMYTLATLPVIIIFFIARAKLRLHALRWIILSAALALDILLSARLMIDRIF